MVVILDQTNQDFGDIDKIFRPFYLHEKSWLWIGQNRTVNETWMRLQCYRRQCKARHGLEIIFFRREGNAGLIQDAIPKHET